MTTRYTNALIAALLISAASGMAALAAEIPDNVPHVTILPDPDDKPQPAKPPQPGEPGKATKEIDRVVGQAEHQGERLGDEVGRIGAQIASAFKKQ